MLVLEFQAKDRTVSRGYWFSIGSTADKYINASEIVTSFKEGKNSLAEYNHGIDIVISKQSLFTPQK